MTLKVSAFERTQIELERRGTPTEEPSNLARARYHLGYAITADPEIALKHTAIATAVMQLDILERVYAYQEAEARGEQ
jgi:hypothetical protein